MRTPRCDYRWHTIRARKYLTLMLRSRRRLLVRVAVLAALIVIILVIALKLGLTCTNLELNSHLTMLCREYADSVVVGELCEDFCVTKAIKPNTCLPMHFGKEVVFTATWGNKEVFVKSVSASIDSDRYAKVYTIDEGTGNKVYPNVDEFEMMAEKYLEDNLGIIPSYVGDIFRTFLNLDILAQEDGVDRDDRILKAMENTWALIQSNEFVLSKVYNDYDIFPHMYGTCGAFYVVEKVEPLQLPGLADKHDFFAWTSRVAAALRLLDLLEELDSIFQEPMLLCDVKPEHFGLSSNKRGKIVDVDNVGLRSVIEKTIGRDNCTSHTDCQYFDCKGRCDLIESKCAAEVANDNLQVVCEKVFLAAHENFLFEIPGLLSSKHVHKKLRSALEACANPSNAEDSVRLAAGDKLNAELKRLFKEVVDISNKLAKEV